MEDRCVCCGAVIPEGRHICPTCERRERKQKINMGYGQQKPLRIIRLIFRWWVLNRLAKKSKKQYNKQLNKSKEPKEETNG